MDEECKGCGEEVIQPISCLKCLQLVCISCAQEKHGDHPTRGPLPEESPGSRNKCQHKEELEFRCEDGQILCGRCAILGGHTVKLLHIENLKEKYRALARLADIQKDVGDIEERLSSLVQDVFKKVQELKDQEATRIQHQLDNLDRIRLNNQQVSGLNFILAVVEKYLMSDPKEHNLIQSKFLQRELDEEAGKSEEVMDLRHEEAELVSLEQEVVSLEQLPAIATNIKRLLSSLLMKVEASRKKSSKRVNTAEQKIDSSAAPLRNPPWDTPLESTQTESPNVSSSPVSASASLKISTSHTVRVIGGKVESFVAKLEPRTTNIFNIKCRLNISCMDFMMNRSINNDFKRLISTVECFTLRVLSVDKAEIPVHTVDLYLPGQPPDNHTSVLHVLRYLGNFPNWTVDRETEQTPVTILPSLLDQVVEAVDELQVYYQTEQDLPTPDRIYVSLDSEEQKQQYQYLVDRLDSYVGSSAQPPGVLTVGSKIVAPWKGGLYRAEVLEIYTQDQNVRVFYLDYGNSSVVSWWDCLALGPDLHLPPLAFPVRLADIQPSDSEGGWSPDCCIFLQKELSKVPELNMRVVKHVRDELWVNLCQETGWDIATLLKLNPVDESPYATAININRPPPQQRFQDNDDVVVEEDTESIISHTVPTLLSSSGTRPIIRNHREADDASLTINNFAGRVAASLLPSSRQMTGTDSSWSSASASSLSEAGTLGDEDMERGSASIPSGANYFTDGHQQSAANVLDRKTGGWRKSGDSYRAGRSFRADGCYGRRSRIQAAIMRGRGKARVQQVLVSGLVSRPSGQQLEEALAARFGSVVALRQLDKQRFQAGLPADSVKLAETLSLGNLQLFGSSADIQAVFGSSSEAESEEEMDVTSRGSTHLSDPIGEEAKSISLLEDRSAEDCKKMAIPFQVPVLGQSGEVQVLSVEDPEHVWVRKLEDRQSFRHMDEDIQDYCRGRWGRAAPDVEEELVAGDCCLLQWDRRYFRARAISLADNFATFRLLDTGEIVRCVCPVRAKIMISEFALQPILAFSIAIQGIEPVGSCGWPDTAGYELLQKMRCKNVFVQQMKELQPGSAHYEGHLEIREIQVKDRFAPEEEIITSAAEFLIKNGLAFKPNTRAYCYSRFDKAVTPSLRAVRLQEEDNTTEIKPADAVGRCEAAGLPVMPSTNEFRADITHMDHNGVLWLRASSQADLWDTLILELEILNPLELSSISEGDISPGALLLWKEGRATPARVKVIKILGSKCTETFTCVHIDTGKVRSYTSRCHLYQLPSQLQVIPPLAFPLMLYGIKKDASLQQGSEDDLNRTVRNFAPSLRCKVFIRIPAQEFPLHGTVQLLGDKPCNLAASLLTSPAPRYFNLTGTVEDWRASVLGSGLGWLGKEDCLTLPALASPLPMPVPFNPAQWIIFDSYEVEENERKRSPDLIASGTHASVIGGGRLACTIIDAILDVHPDREDIKEDLKAFRPIIERFHKMNLAGSNEETGEMMEEADMVLGSIVKVYHKETKEYARAKIVSAKPSGVVDVYFIDYGHAYSAHSSQIRSILKDEQLNPVGAFKFRVSAHQLEQARIRKMLDTDINDLLLGSIQTVDYASGHIVLRTIYRVNSRTKELDLIK